MDTINAIICDTINIRPLLSELLGAINYGDQVKVGHDSNKFIIGVKHTPETERILSGALTVLEQKEARLRRQIGWIENLTPKQTDLTGQAEVCGTKHTGLGFYGFYYFRGGSPVKGTDGLLRNDNVPWITVCVYADIHKSARGIAVCSYKETPNKEFGRNLAKKRVVDALNHKHDSKFIGRDSNAMKVLIDCGFPEDLSYNKSMRPALSQYDIRLSKRELRILLSRSSQILTW